MKITLNADISVLARFLELDDQFRYLFTLGLCRFGVGSCYNPVPSLPLAKVCMKRGQLKLLASLGHELAGFGRQPGIRLFCLEQIIQ